MAGDGATPGGEGDRGDLIDVLVAVESSGLERTVAGLRSAGLLVDQILPAIGAVTGSVASHRLPVLHAVTGVIAVERQRDVHVPPPDGDLQ